MRIQGYSLTNILPSTANRGGVQSPYNTLRENFTEKKAGRALYELERQTTELVKTSIWMAVLARQSNDAWWHKTNA